MSLREEDLRIEVYRPKQIGMYVPGDAAVRITHLPTGLSATATGERSQLQNKAKALLELEDKVRNLEQGS